MRAPREQPVANRARLPTLPARRGERRASPSLRARATHRGSHLKTTATRLLAGALALGLTACNTMSNISSVQPGTTVALREHVVSAPAKQKLFSTSFTNYEFRATHPAAPAPFYGVAPLQFRPGHLVADILLFAPGLFLNLRTAYPYYEFDAVNQVVRYKSEAGDAWTEYRPTAAEIARAQAYFKDAAPAAPTASVGGASSLVPDVE